MPRVIPALLALLTASGCVYDSPSLGQLRCSQEGQVQGDRRCVEGLWIVASDQDMRLPPQDLGQDMAPPPDMASPDLDQGVRPDMRPDMMDPPDFPADMPDSAPDQDMTPASVCGDGVVGPGERCDDGGVTPGDGCSPTCQIEDGWECLSGQRCSPVCGDGRVISPQEQCDDGDLDADDGCSATCRVEDGWTCQGSPSVCQKRPNTIGDGVLDAGEQCDDGNAASGDGCDDQGQIEPSFLCPTPGASCRRVLRIILGGAVQRLTPLGGTNHGAEGQPRCSAHQAVFGVEGYHDGDNLEGTRLLCATLDIDPDTGRVRTTDSKPTSYFGATDKVASLSDKRCDADEVVVGYSGFADFVTGRHRVRGIHLLCNGFEVTQGSLKATRAGAVKRPLHGFSLNLMESASVLCPSGHVMMRANVRAEDDLRYFEGECQQLRFVLCGDGMVSAGEECDDGNTFNGDGCSSACKIE